METVHRRQLACLSVIHLAQPLMKKAAALTQTTSVRPSVLLVIRLRLKSVSRATWVVRTQMALIRIVSAHRVHTAVSKALVFRQAFTHALIQTIPKTTQPCLGKLVRSPTWETRSPVAVLVPVRHQQHVSQTATHLHLMVRPPLPAPTPIIFVKRQVRLVTRSPLTFVSLTHSVAR